VFKNLFRRQPVEPTPTASGITVMLLQSRLERFTTERLNNAMRLGWREPIVDGSFFATDLSGEGAVLKVNSTFYTITHNDRRLGGDELGKRSIPDWAMHGGFSALRAAFPGGIPDDMLPMTYGFLGLILAQLMTTETMGLFFLETGTFVPNSDELRTRLQSAENFTPSQLPGAA
jgi:hypothetical protein